MPLCAVISKNGDIFGDSLYFSNSFDSMVIILKTIQDMHILFQNCHLIESLNSHIIIVLQFKFLG